MTGRPIALLESLRWEPATGYYLLVRHLERLQASAKALGYTLSLSEVHSRLAAHAALLTTPRKVRVLVSQDGSLAVEDGPLAPSTQVLAQLALHPIDPEHLWLRHKTTERSVYEQALLDRPGADDVLLWNTRGEVTETTRGNLCYELQTVLYTPPLSSGLLPGTFRAELLARGELHERPMLLTDLDLATGLWLLNSVRGRCPLVLLPKADYNARP